MITADELRAFNPRLLPGMAAIYAAALDGVLAQAEINTTLRIRHFMAQLAHESAGFQGLTESLHYTDPQRLQRLFKNVQTVEHAQALIARGERAIGNCIYAYKNGNGNEASGDGYAYRGRGFIMNTGRANYAKVERYAGLDVIAHPEKLSEPDTAALAAAIYWKTCKINLAADKDDIVAVTALINPAMQGLEDRKQRYAVAQRFWSAGG
jgi:putative chitinase